jgi:hypothetical protein
MLVRLIVCTFEEKFSMPAPALAIDTELPDSVKAQAPERKAMERGAVVRLPVPAPPVQV